MTRSCLSNPFVKFLVIVASVLLILILFRTFWWCSGSSFLNLIMFMAYTIPDLLVPYTIGLMESANFHNSLFVVWTMFLILALGSASSISAYTLDDNEHWKRRKIVQLVQLFWAFWLLLTYAENWKVALPLAIILVLSGLRMADAKLLGWLLFHMVLLQTPNWLQTLCTVNMVSVWNSFIWF